MTSVPALFENRRIAAFRGPQNLGQREASRLSVGEEDVMKYPDLTAGDGEFLLNLIGGWERFQQIKTGALTLVVKGADLLRQVATTSVRAVTQFSAKDTFGAAKPAITLGYLGDTFKKVMLGKVEENVPAAELAIHTLTKDSLDAPILTELGDRAEVSLAHVWELLTRQPRGESGTLLTDGSWNIFYVRGTDGPLWAVSAIWYAGFGWYVVAYSMDDPIWWPAGSQVVSRK